MHRNCSHQCMVAAGVKGMPARYSYYTGRRHTRCLWLITDQQNAELLARVFPEWFRNELRGEAVLIKGAVQ